MSKQTGAPVDPITLAVVRGALETAQREMTLTLEKTGRSSVFNLAHDYSNALFDHHPEMILQGQDIPIHLGSLIPAMKAVADFFGDDLHEGDIIYHNDPVYQGSHILDCCMYKPVFHEGELVFWAVCKGHLTDIGGPVPAGYNPDARDLYAEGLRIPPVKLWDRGVRRDDVINLLLCNMRARRDQEGDLNAQYGACRVGERHLRALLAKYGLATVQAAIAELKDMADRHMRSLIASIPDGTYHGRARAGGRRPRPWRHDHLGGGDGQRRQRAHPHRQPAAGAVLHQFLRGQFAVGHLPGADDVRPCRRPTTPGCTAA